jgi:hypothetical protein
MNKLLRSLNAVLRDPMLFARLVGALPYGSDSAKFATLYRSDDTCVARKVVEHNSNPLWQYFTEYQEGPGIWKWQHYFDIYHRHFAQFVNRKVDVLEVGVYSGGSLDMWHKYFGPQSHIYGVDIVEACKKYESNHVSIFIGDQADRTFWARFSQVVKGIDILIDDGGHSPEQQQVTLEEMLPRLRPGGIYMCEDIHHRFNGFTEFAVGLVRELNAFSQRADQQKGTELTSFQSAIHSIHFYPFVMVVEKHLLPATNLASLKRGTEWSPAAL